MAGNGNIVRFPDLAAVEAEAAAWVACFDGGDVSAEDHAKFQVWLGQSPLHRDALADYGSLWSRMDELGGLAPSARSESAVSTLPRRFSRRRVAAYAAAVLVSAMTTGLVYRHFQEEKPVQLAYETTVGAQRNVTLPDGSTVALNTNSRIEVSMSGARRDIRLVRGEAYFEVVHDAKRSFTVLTDEGAVRDIGTAFSVQILKQGVDVAVTKGSVAISATPREPSAKEQQLGVVKAGQGVLFARKILRSQSLSDSDLNRKLAWRQGVLVYAGEPLADVLADISRYSKIKIELTDPVLRDRPVAGYFRISQIDAVFTALEGNFGVHAEWRDPTHVRLSAAHRKRQD